MRDRRYKREEKENVAGPDQQRTITRCQLPAGCSCFPGDTPCPDNTHTSKDNPVLIDVRPSAFAIPAARPAADTDTRACIHIRHECNNLASVFIVI